MVERINGLNVYRGAADATLGLKNTDKAQARGRDGDTDTETNEVKEDRVSISTEAKAANSVLQADNGERASRVAALKEQVANGTYNVSSDDVAKKLVGYFNSVA